MDFNVNFTAVFTLSRFMGRTGLQVAYLVDLNQGRVCLLSFKCSAWPHSVFKVSISVGVLTGFRFLLFKVLFGSETCI